MRINIRIIHVVVLIIVFFMFSCSDYRSSEEYKELKNKIENGLIKEQQLRKQQTEKMKAGNFDIDLNEQMGIVDSLNLIVAIEYLEKYGYPSFSKNGKVLSNGIFNILQHNDASFMEKYINDLGELAKKGEASKKQFAMMKDRILLSKNKKQIYGTQSVPRKDKNGYVTMQYYIWPIEDNSIVDSLRNEFGFDETIKEYAKAIDSEYDVNEKIPSK